LECFKCGNSKLPIYGGQPTSFFINKILLPDSNSLQLLLSGKK
jgi:hypothetical protein